jgi:regulator of cell morphogenesis and NO signaling
VKTEQLSPDTPVGRIAAMAPLATRVFARHGIDFCCGGGRPLREVCDERGLAVDAVLAELKSEMEAPGAAT